MKGLDFETHESVRLAKGMRMKFDDDYDGRLDYNIKSDRFESGIPLDSRLLKYSLEEMETQERMHGGH